MNVTHPNQPLGTATLKEHLDLTELHLWWDRDKTREGEYPEKAYLYTYTGPDCQVPDIGPRSYVVLDKGLWWHYFDTDLSLPRDTPEEVACDLIEMDMESLTDIPCPRTPSTYKYNPGNDTYTKIN